MPSSRLRKAYLHANERIDMLERHRSDTDMEVDIGTVVFLELALHHRPSHLFYRTDHS